MFLKIFLFRVLFFFRLFLVILVFWFFSITDVSFLLFIFQVSKMKGLGRIKFCRALQVQSITFTSGQVLADLGCLMCKILIGSLLWNVATLDLNVTTLILNLSGTS